MFERFTRDAGEVVVEAQRRARDLGHGRIGTEHLLVGLLVAEPGVVTEVLAGAGITLDQTIARIHPHRAQR